MDGRRNFAGTRVGLLQLGIEPAEAKDFIHRGLSPDMLVRTENGIEVLDVEELDAEELQIQEDLQRLPVVIQAGRFDFIRHSTAMGGDPVPYDFSFTWNGQREADWYMDISVTADISPGSSSPTTGTIAWPNGSDLKLTYHWMEFSKKGKATFDGSAPTAAHPESDDDTRDPRRWIGLADLILGYMFDQM